MGRDAGVAARKFVHSRACSEDNKKFFSSIIICNMQYANFRDFSIPVLLASCLHCAVQANGTCHLLVAHKLNLKHTLVDNPSAQLGAQYSKAHHLEVLHSKGKSSNELRARELKMLSCLHNDLMRFECLEPLEHTY